MVDIYLSKLEESLKARAEGNEEIEDQILEELDKIWFALSEEELVVVRGEVYKRVRGLPYPEQGAIVPSASTSQHTKNSNVC